MSMTAPTHVPFLDLVISHQHVRDAIARDFEAMIDTSAFVNGPPVREFESQFAEYCATAECVGLASGLDALRLALTALDVEPGTR